jgi:hypothetical protein
LAGGQLCENPQCCPGGDGFVDRSRVRGQCFPSRRAAEVFEVRVAAFDGGEAVGLVDGHDEQPGEAGAASGLILNELRPGGLAGVLDQFGRGVDGAAHGTPEVSVVALEEIFFVAADLRRVTGCGRRLHAPRRGQAGGR